MDAQFFENHTLKILIIIMKGPWKKIGTASTIFFLLVINFLSFVSKVNFSNTKFTHPQTFPSIPKDVYRSNNSEKTEYSLLLV